MDFVPGSEVLPILPDPDTAMSPVAGLAWNESRPRLIGSHRHHRGQIVSVVRGAATVGTEFGIWVLPPGQAMWVPAETTHWVRYSGTLASRSLFTDAASSARFPRRCVTLHLDALSRELVNAAVDFRWDLDPADYEMRLVNLLMERLRVHPQAALKVPDAKDRRIARIMARIRQAPDDNRTLAQWSKEAGASERTLARLFLRETGMTFSTWRRQYRLMLALEQLAMGTPVTAIAHSLGYDTAGNFSTMFRGVFHRSPREFFRDVHDSL
jgi:AraC-like DNA-binding protein